MADSLTVVLVGQESRGEKIIIDSSVCFVHVEKGTVNFDRAMVACYSGSGTFYRQHVDNLNKDGRVVTCICYLNKDCDPQERLKQEIENQAAKAGKSLSEEEIDAILSMVVGRCDPRQIISALGIAPRIQTALLSLAIDRGFNIR